MRKVGGGQPTSLRPTRKLCTLIFQTFTHPSDGARPIEFRWYRPDGTRENDVGTNVLAHSVYDSGIFLGFWTYMVIKEKSETLLHGVWNTGHMEVKVECRTGIACALNTPT